VLKVDFYCLLLLPTAAYTKTSAVQYNTVPHNTTLKD